MMPTIRETVMIILFFYVLIIYSSLTMIDSPYKRVLHDDILTTSMLSGSRLIVDMALWLSTPYDRASVHGEPPQIVDK